jgi:hypothetical protein
MRNRLVVFETTYRARCGSGCPSREYSRVGDATPAAYPIQYAPLTRCVVWPLGSFCRRKNFRRRDVACTKATPRCEYLRSGRLIDLVSARPRAESSRAFSGRSPPQQAAVTKDSSPCSLQVISCRSGSGRTDLQRRDALCRLFRRAITIEASHSLEMLRPRACVAERASPTRPRIRGDPGTTEQGCGLRLRIR